MTGQQLLATSFPAAARPSGVITPEIIKIWEKLRYFRYLPNKGYTTFRGSSNGLPSLGYFRHTPPRENFVKLVISMHRE